MEAGDGSPLPFIPIYNILCNALSLSNLGNLFTCAISTDPNNFTISFLASLSVNLLLSD